MTKFPFYFLLALLITSCVGGSDPDGENGDMMAGVLSYDTLANGAIHVVSAPEGAWAREGTQPWRLSEDLRIGVIEGDEHYLFGHARNVIPRADGGIWVLDAMAFELRHYNQDGAFVRAVGRNGQGPGEFGSTPCAFPGPSGEVWVEAGGRWQSFDPDGHLLGGQQVTRRLDCGVLVWPPNGRLIAVTAFFDPATREPSFLFLVHDREETGEVVVVDTVPRPTLPAVPEVQWIDDDGRAWRTEIMPLVPVPTYVLGPNGDLWITEGNGDYRIRRQTIFGDTAVIMERPYDPIPVPDSIRSQQMPERRKANFRLDPDFNPDDVPHVFPPFDRYFVGTDGTLWVRRQLEGGKSGLDVFAADGRFLGPVEPPPEFDRIAIHRITSDHMYGIARDELEVQYVVRLTIQKPEG